MESLCRASELARTPLLSATLWLCTRSKQTPIFKDSQQDVFGPDLSSPRTELGSSRHVGIYLGSEPFSGGTHQYSLSVVQALAGLAAIGCRLTAFTERTGWRPVLPAEFGLVETLRPRYVKGVSFVYRQLDRSHLAQRRVGWMIPVIRAMNASGCGLILFPGQDVAGYQVRLPALVAVHDLMHRYEPHFDEYQHGAYAARERHYRNICQFAAGILVDSEIGRQQIIESYGVDRAKIFVLPFVPPPYLGHSSDPDVRSKYGLPERYLFYPAQFWEHKNHLRLIEAVSKLKASGILVKLVLSGEPKNNYARVIQRIRELRLEDDVHILGYVPNEDMVGLYRSATGTVFVSLIGPTNIPPLEAMALGSPLVVSNAYAMPDQVGDAALLIDPKSVDDIAEKMALVWTDENLRRDLQRRGWARSATWTDSHFRERLLQIVYGLLERKTDVGDAVRNVAAAEE